MANPLPVPDDQRRRRNAPTIPTTNLPAAGRVGPIPRIPPGYGLGRAGRAWWRWAWRTPQAAAWSDGDLYSIARRAQLEDEAAVLRSPVDVDEVGSMASILDFARSIVGSDSAVKKQMTELDDRLGLSPKAMATLRWRIVEDEPAPPAVVGGTAPAGGRGLQVVL